MRKIQKISVEQLCTSYSIETSFLQELHEHGLIELSWSGKEIFIDDEQISNVEKYMRMHYELEINIPGIEAITHLLHRMQHLQQEIKRLQGESDNG